MVIILFKAVSPQQLYEEDGVIGKRVQRKLQCGILLPGKWISGSFLNIAALFSHCAGKDAVTHLLWEKYDGSGDLYALPINM